MLVMVEVTGMSCSFLCSSWQCLCVILSFLLKYKRIYTHAQWIASQLAFNVMKVNVAFLV